MVGGCNYGDYMLSHNINPHRLGNNPTHPQVYETAEKMHGYMEAYKAYKAAKQAEAQAGKKEESQTTLQERVQKETDKRLKEQTGFNPIVPAPRKSNRRPKTSKPKSVARRAEKPKPAKRSTKDLPWENVCTKRKRAA